MILLCHKPFSMLDGKYTTNEYKKKHKQTLTYTYKAKCSSQSKSKCISYLISILIVLGWLLGIYKSLTARGKRGRNWYNYYNPACFIALNSRFLSFSIINWRR
ncbi:hypothetical protein L2E82_36821 [Cichorium intybus]|uniref:Uncharacterized protein n=1 Tax=Cichorium intybus TaxID=13427 RepID=A0ACB9AEV6_CICIN|nr:hypothetical protein L2E82_36821 [Cichorium intybus]